MNWKYNKKHQCMVYSIVMAERLVPWVPGMGREGEVDYGTQQNSIVKNPTHTWGGGVSRLDLQRMERNKQICYSVVTTF